MIGLGLGGTSGPEGRDLTIDAMTAVAERLSRKYDARVSAIRYGEGLHEIDGSMVWTGPLTDDGWMGPTLYVPVRRRLRIGRLSGSWREVESVAAAAARVGRAVGPSPS